jgi:hypothetical protein
VGDVELEGVDLVDGDDDLELGRARAMLTGSMLVMTTVLFDWLTMSTRSKVSRNMKSGPDGSEVWITESVLSVDWNRAWPRSLSLRIGATVKRLSPSGSTLAPMALPTPATVTLIALTMRPSGPTTRIGLGPESSRTSASQSIRFVPSGLSTWP